MAKIKAIIFDLDGVLGDFADWHYEALNKALALFGLSISRDNHLSTYDGLPTARKLEMLNVDPFIRPAIAALKQCYTLDMIRERTKAAKPTTTRLGWLLWSIYPTYDLAVASNSVRSTIMLALDAMEIGQYFTTILSNEDVTHAKPNAEMYLTAAAKLGVQPSECVVLEDNRNGIKAAKDAGCHVLEIGDIEEVNLANVQAFIGKVEDGNGA